MINRADKVFNREEGELHHYTKVYRKKKIKDKIKRASMVYNKSKKTLPFIFKHKEENF